MRARPIACTNPLEVAVIGCQLPSSVGLAECTCMSSCARPVCPPTKLLAIYAGLVLERVCTATRRRLLLPPVAPFRARSQARAHKHVLYVMSECFAPSASALSRHHSDAGWREGGRKGGGGNENAPPCLLLSHPHPRSPRRLPLRFCCQTDFISSHFGLIVIECVPLTHR
jgi:hypothetical protein